jgi:hypothetical protein
VLFINNFAFGQRQKRSAVRFAPLAGIGATNMSWEQNRSEMNSKVRVGYTMGVLAEFAINRNVYFQPGIAFSGKGYRFSYDVNSPVEKKQSINYIDIPLNIKFSRTHDMTDMSLFGGPYVSYGLWGKNKTFKSGVSPEVVDARFGHDKVLDDYIRLDAGLNIGISIEMLNFQYILQYGIGFINISPKENEYMRNRFISFSVAYMISP